MVNSLGPNRTAAVESGTTRATVVCRASQTYAAASNSMMAMTEVQPLSR